MRLGLWCVRQIRTCSKDGGGLTENRALYSGGKPEVTDRLV